MLGISPSKTPLRMDQYGPLHLESLLDPDGVKSVRNRDLRVFHPCEQPGRWYYDSHSVNFSVDGGLPVPFQIPNLSTTALQYDSLVSSRTNLSNGDHRLNITTTGSTNIYVNFDYAIYTLVEDQAYRSRFLTITFLNIVRMILHQFRQSHCCHLPLRNHRHRPAAQCVQHQGSLQLRALLLGPQRSR